ncbi:hypothetical protein [Companilactobacillus sp.]|uniref:hypothetical protein n=1 Tax=Companilactobacillus sp. TaxID=2767905 RepID=UPI00260DFCB9|nr:hypothetical protein [Companilactobacillus sp.]
MSDRAQRVLDALMEYDADRNIGYPILAILKFFNDDKSRQIGEDYESLTVEEEKQVIKAFLEFAY